MSRYIGQIGEDLAKLYLRNQNYTILKTNIFSRFGEIDILCRKAKDLYLVEVKTDNNNSHYSLSNVTPQKVNRLLQTFYSQKLINPRIYANIQILIIHITLSHGILIKSYLLEPI
ncbi:YraN family protein [Candidatus Dojkabacteria bacterium]|nr:YraN family protein [Candidatus Dojkabacteria bacterium]